MSLQPRRRALLVTGMHRSGTSCVSRITNLTGLAIGSDLLPPQEDNPTGFWEHAALRRLNDAILASLDTTWDSLAPLPEDWWKRPEIDGLKRTLRNIIERDFADKTDFVVKDPRICLLMPLWRDVLTEIGCEVEILIVMRDVEAVVASLDKRNSLPRWHSELLWLRYNLMAEYHSREDRRALIHYEDVVNDWRNAFGKVIGSVGLRIPDPDSTASQAIDGFVSPLLNHAIPDVLDRAVEASPWSTAVSKALAREGALSDASSLEELDRVRAEFLAADPLIAPQDRHWRSEYLRLKEEADVSHLLDSRFVSIGEEWQRRVDRLVDQAESDRRVTAHYLTRLDSLELDFKRQDQERLTELVQERDDLRQQGEAAKRLQRTLHQKLVLEASQNRSHEDRIQTLIEELALSRSSLSEMQSASAQLEADLDNSVSELREQLHASQAELNKTREDLHAHSTVMTRMANSRSWKITRPLRGLTSIYKRSSLKTRDTSVGQLVAWHELLPGRPFRQRFWPPVSELSEIDVGFFTYGKDNHSSVRIRLFEASKWGRNGRLIEEIFLHGDDICDGETSSVVLKETRRQSDTSPLIIEIECLDGHPGETVTVALGAASYRGQILSRDLRGESKTHGLLVLEMRSETVQSRKAFGFVSGCPGGAYRYRCIHQAEMLRLRGYSVDILPADEFPWTQALESYQVVVAHRVPHTPEFESFVIAAKERGVYVVFDTDDLIFDPEIEKQIAALDDLNRTERELWLDGVLRYRKSLALVDRVMVSTRSLKHSIESRFKKKVLISRNRVSDEMLAQAASAKGTRSNSDPTVRIGYLSGTPTHRRDFAECVPALAIIMKRNLHVRLSLVGHIEVPVELTAFSNRIDFVPLVAWQELPEIYADIDINLAPLERGNEFTEGKSELKYFEAALLAVPTLASRVGGYKDAIQDGKDGYLCDSTDDWILALEHLVSDGDLRKRIGLAARKSVHGRYTSRAAASKTVDTWLDLLGPRIANDRPLRVAMVVRAPIANTGGGYKKVFHLVHYLSMKGHDVSVYVEPIAHLHEKSQSFIANFCRENFECGDAQIVAGHDSIADCDVAIATNWPTANVVNELPNARLRLYFIQDDEREFYSETDPLRAAAAATYDLPLLIVGIGGYLSQLMGERNQLVYPHIDFALSAMFFDEREKVEAKLDAITTSTEASLLFFARPGILRRAFDMGVEALTKFQRERPEVRISLYGLEEHLELPFEYVDLGIIDQDQLASEMRNTTAHLSFSRTNASTVIFEAMACGMVAVELDMPAVRSLLDDPAACVLCDDSADAVSQSLVELFDDREKMSRIARIGFESVSTFTIENMCRQFEEILVHYSLSDRSLD